LKRKDLGGSFSQTPAPQEATLSIMFRSRYRFTTRMGHSLVQLGGVSIQVGAGQYWRVEREMPKDWFKQEAEKELTGRKTELCEILLFPI